jgi:phage terminase large subunit-like protein
MSSLALRTAAKAQWFYDPWVRRIPERHVQGVHASWRFWGRTGQRQPEGDWRTWMIMAGRGFGKTRAGAEWVHECAMTGDHNMRIAIVAATPDEARRVMVEGESGLLSVGLFEEQPTWEPSLMRLIWRSGAQAALYGASSPEALRGPQHHFAWCDEFAKWPYAQATWDNLQLGLRLGDAPRALITTTPRPTRAVKALTADRSTLVTNGSTFENLNLPKAYTEAVTSMYAGRQIGRQELDGELIEEFEGALWTRDMIEACRISPMPIGKGDAFRRVVIGVDPPASAGGDACGIVVVGLDADGVGHVIADASVSGKLPEGWAAIVADAAAVYGADRVVAEANNGGAMVESVLRAADSGLPVKLVHASHGKVARAEPVMVLYKAGRVKHVGAFPELEDELCGMISGGSYEGPGRSPDRADALVWAMTELMLGRRVSVPRVRVV